MGADTSSGRQDNPRSVGTHGIQPPTGQGPLSGVRVVEFSGIGPGPFCAMMLSDICAEATAALAMDLYSVAQARPDLFPALAGLSVAASARALPPRGANHFAGGRHPRSQ